MQIEATLSYWSVTTRPADGSSRLGVAFETVTRTIPEVGGVTAPPVRRRLAWLRRALPQRRWDDRTWAVAEPRLRSSDTAGIDRVFGSICDPGFTDPDEHRAAARSVDAVFIDGVLHVPVRR